ncbi:hypothetical protein L873DRAFT_1812992 [Choiromyces venosus 120613-1]|uniref:Intermediate filament protein n=1 Tax=Choiromyces venosus 120613-1 TaxID=1336337 RepID=A0A3N4JDG7_9PEZI|nr:hypothetical protein L873DRAFT_1812992 [Choiromyces venosus 120613-1]
MHRRSLALTAVILLLLLNTTAQYFPSLRLIIWAFFTGSAASIILLLALGLFTVHRRPSDNNVLKTIKPLAFASPALWSKEVEAIALEDSFHRLPLYPPSFVLSDSIDVILENVLRDFVNSWYSNISSDPSFTIQVDRTIRHALEVLRDRIQTLDLVEVMVGKIVPLLTAHLHDFSAAERAVRGKYLNKDLTESEELDLAIAGKYREGKLHPAASLKFSDTKLAQQDHLRLLVDKILPVLLPERERKSRAVVTIVKEIVACGILFPVMGILSDPDTWNQFIEAIGRSTLQDRKTVRKLRAALDQHATPRHPNSLGHLRNYSQVELAPSQPFIRLSARDDERTFERFIRSIRLCNNLSDARRLRNEISAQLKRDERVEPKEGWGVYLRRLETGKREVDRRVSQLSAGVVGPGGGPIRTQSEVFAPKQTTTSHLEFATLQQVLRDSSGLSYFMEHMDRRRRLPLVQFWLVVDGLRNPLEEDVSSSDDEQETSTATAHAAWTPSDRADIAQIHEAYLSMSELQIREKTKFAVKEFLKAGSNATQEQYIRARAAVLRAQTAVLEEMQQKDFLEFRASDLFYKYLASDETATAQVRPVADRTSREMVRSSSWANASHTVETSDPMTSSRHSLDGAKPAERSLEDWDFDPLSNSRHSLDEEPLQYSQYLSPQQQEPRHSPENGIVEAMEAALNDIIEDRPSLDESRCSPFQNSPVLTGPNSPRSSIDVSRDSNSNGSGSASGNGNKLTMASAVKDKVKAKPPSISSLGLVGASASGGVFADDELFPDEAAAADYHSSDGEAEDKNGIDGGSGSDDEIRQAAPGDLGLAEAIAALTFDIEKLSTQEAVVDSLYRKAELTNNTVELRILRKSKASLHREIRRKELQRQQYIVQESDNSLYGRATIRIKSTKVGKENGQEYALYIIEVHRPAGDQMPPAIWTVPRRYSEFLNLHQTLRSTFPSVKPLDFPRRRVVMKFQKDFLEKRRVSLETYLRSLLLLPDVCRSRTFRSFLSQNHIAPIPSASSSDPGILTPADYRRDIMSRLYNSIADGVEDVLGTIPLLDQLSQQNPPPSIPFPQLQQQHQSNPPSIISDETIDAAEAEAELSAFENRESTPFVKPICDIFLEVFELNQGSNWLRGRAVVVVLQQLLGGTIERKVREQVRGLVDEEGMIRYLAMLKATLWPEEQPEAVAAVAGQQQGQGQQAGRSPKEKGRTGNEAKIILATLVPDLAGSVVGRENARAAGRRLFAGLNNGRLNSSIAYTILDELVGIVFDERL